MAAEGLDALLVTHPANVRWLSDFTAPDDARVLLTSDDAVLMTDGRYVAQAGEESGLRATFDRDWQAIAVDAIGVGRCGLEADHVTLDLAAQLTTKLGRPWTETKGLVQAARRVKDASEIATIRRAAALTDQAFQHGLAQVRAGVREIDVSLAITTYVRRHGGDGMAFETIVASGIRSAMPHGTASSKVIERGDLVTIDMGAKVDGYCADMTRTFGVGAVSDSHRSLFEAVLEAQEAAMLAVGPGVPTADVDRLARSILDRHGLGEAFSHSLGHGVGLYIHEGPGLSHRSDEVLTPGDVVTIEPGAYHPGDAGVRIEDLVHVTQDGTEVLSSTPKTWLEVPAS